MMTIPLTWVLCLALAMFVVGLAIVLSHRDIVRAWIGVFTVLQAASLALAAFASMRGVVAGAQVIPLVLVAAGLVLLQVCVGFAITARVRRHFASSRAEDLDLLRE